MRAIVLAATIGLVLSACGKTNQTSANQNGDESLSADNIVSNDVTAIDAVTGDAANMADDVNYQDSGDSIGNGGTSAAPSRPGSTAGKPATHRPDEPAAGTPASNAAENGAE